jgi:hypothetical protein
LAITARTNFIGGLGSGGYFMNEYDLWRAGMAPGQSKQNIAPGQAKQNIAGITVQLQMDQGQFDGLNTKLDAINAKLDQVLKAIENKDNLSSVTATLKKSEDALSSVVEQNQPQP